jgi:DNA ligase (NAD+)
VAKTLAKHFKSIDNLIKARYEDLTTIHEIGNRIASSVQEYFNNEKNLEIVDKLKQAGVNLEIKEETEASNILNGSRIVISGTFEIYSRDQLKAMIEKYGGKNTSSVSSNTDYLLAGSNIGPKKLNKAKENKIPVISEKDFLEMIGE